MSGLSRPRPRRIVPIRRASSSTKRSCAGSWSRSRVGAVQVCAEFCISVVAAETAARSRSASANTILADLPPSSSVTGTTWSAAAFMIAIPVGTEPVKVMWSMPGWEASAAPVSRPPVTTLKTPAGSPASTATSARRTTLRPASAAGLATTPLPHASAGAIPREARRSG